MRQIKARKVEISDKQIMDVSVFDEKSIIEELVMTAENDSKAYAKKDPKAAAKGAVETYKKLAAKELDSYVSKVAKIVGDKWKETYDGTLF